MNETQITTSLFKSEIILLYDVIGIVVNRGGGGRGVPKSTHDATETDHADQNETLQYNIHFSSKHNRWYT
jgi:hypothetical protein